MNYIVLDVEATDNAIKEIIEIGAIKVNEKMEVISQYQSLVRPLVDTTLNWHIRNLTNIQQDEVDNARSFVEVYNEFLNWVGEDSLIVTWGKADRGFFAKDLYQNKLDVSLLNRFVNIQGAVSKILLSENEMGLKKALDALDIEQEGEAHRALNDALNTSKIFIKLFNMLGVKELKSDFDNFGLDLNKQVAKSNYKINFAKYKRYLNRLSIVELEAKLNMLTKVIENELRSIKHHATYLYIITKQKYDFVKESLAVKRKKAALQSEGMKGDHLEAFIKSANILYTLKEGLIRQINDDATEVYLETKRIINRLKKTSKKFGKLEYLNLKKTTLIQQLREVISLVNQLNSSLFTREKYKYELKGIHNRVTTVLRDLGYVEAQMEAS